MDCHCKCNGCGKVSDCRGIFEYDKEIFPNHTYEQFLELCHSNDNIIEETFKKELCFICKDCGSEMPILEVIDSRLEYNLV